MDLCNKILNIKWLKVKFLKFFSDIYRNLPTTNVFDATSLIDSIDSFSLSFENPTKFASEDQIPNPEALMSEMVNTAEKTRVFSV